MLSVSGKSSLPSSNPGLLVLGQPNLELLENFRPLTPSANFSLFVVHIPNRLSLTLNLTCRSKFQAVVALRRPSCTQANCSFEATALLLLYPAGPLLPAMSYTNCTHSVIFTNCVTNCRLDFHDTNTRMTLTDCSVYIAISGTSYMNLTRNHTVGKCLL